MRHISEIMRPVLDALIIREAIPLWRKGHKASKSRLRQDPPREDLKDKSSPMDWTVDDLLASYGITFANDRRTWLAYAHEITRQAMEAS